MMNQEEKIAELQAKLEKLEGKINHLDIQFNGDPKTTEFRGLRFQNNGTWAIHYSIVRLTIATFVITTCITITGFQWETLTTPIVTAVATIGLMGLSLFYTFTHLTLKMMMKQRERAGDQNLKMSSFWKADTPSYIVAIFALIYIIVVACHLNTNTPRTEQPPETDPTPIVLPNNSAH